MKMHVINGTDYVWAASEDSARGHFIEEVPDEPITTVEVLANDDPVYVQEPAEGGEAIWWTKKHPGWNVLEKTTVGVFFKSYCNGIKNPFTVYSTNW